MFSSMHIVAVVSLTLFCGLIEAVVKIEAGNIHMSPTTRRRDGQKENEVVWLCERGHEDRKAAPNSNIVCKGDDLKVYGDVNTLTSVESSVNNSLKLYYFDTNGYSLGPGANVVTGQLLVDAGHNNHSFILAPDSEILTGEDFIVKTEDKFLKLAVEADAAVLCSGNFVFGDKHNTRVVSEMHVQGGIISLEGVDITSRDLSIIVGGSISVAGGSLNTYAKTAHFTIEENARLLVHGNSLEIDADSTVLDVNGTLCVDKDLILKKDHLSINKGLNSTFLIGGSVVDGNGKEKVLPHDVLDNIEFLKGNETCADFFLIDDVTQKPSAAPSAFIFSFQSLIALSSMAYLLN